MPHASRDVELHAFAPISADRVTSLMDCATRRRVRRAERARPDVAPALSIHSSALSRMLQHEMFDLVSEPDLRPRHARVLLLASLGVSARAIGVARRIEALPATGSPRSASRRTNRKPETLVGNRGVTAAHVGRGPATKSSVRVDSESIVLDDLGSCSRAHIGKRARDRVEVASCCA
jgi:hypothetical protein